MFDNPIINGWGIVGGASLNAYMFCYLYNFCWCIVDGEYVDQFKVIRC